MTGERGGDDAVKLTPSQVSELAALLQRDGVRTLQLTTARGRFDITLEDAEIAPAAHEQEPRPGETVRAPAVGEFLTSHPARTGLLARQGARVVPGDLLALLRTGLVLAPVTLPADDPRPATLTRVLVPHGTLVGYGTPLFEVERH